MCVCGEDVDFYVLCWVFEAPAFTDNDLPGRPALRKYQEPSGRQLAGHAALGESVLTQLRSAVPARTQEREGE